MLTILLASATAIVALAACRALWHGSPPAFPNSEARDLARADRLAKLNNWDAAGPIYADLEVRFRRKGDLRDEIYAHVSRFGLEEESSDLQNVSQELKATLLRPIVRNDLQLKQRCLEIKSHIDLNLDGVSARPSLEELERVARQRNDADAASRASGELGILAFLEGNPAQARDRVLAALAASILHGDAGAQIRYLSLMGQGLAETGKASEALWSLNRALAISRGTPDAGFPKLVVSGKASSLTQLGRFSEARAVINDGLQYAKNHGYKGFQVDMLSQSAQLSVAENNRREAIRLYERAADLARQIRFNRGLAEVNAKLAALYQQAGNLPLAKEREERSIDAHLHLGEVYELPHHLALKANLQQAIGEPEAARTTYLAAERIVGTMLRNSPTPGVKQSVIACMDEIYQGHFRQAVAEHNLDEAFGVIEEARGRVAADRLRSAETERRPRPEIAAAERRLALLQMKLLDTEDPLERRSISDSLTEIEQETPEDENLVSAPGKIPYRLSLRDLQSVLEPHEALLEYVSGNPRSYCLVVKRDHVEAVELPAGGAIDGLADQDLAALKNKSPATSEGRRLYSAAMKPLEGLIQNDDLVVIPDGGLYRVPFAALVDGANQYLLETHTINYAASGTVLTLLRRASQIGAKELLAVGNVSYGDQMPASGGWPMFRGLDTLVRRAFKPLPATKDEVRSVATTMRDLNGVILSGRDATESRFKRETANHPSVIHLAVHAFADKNYPDRAGLVFAQNDAGEDGLLQVREIRRLPLSRTSLVTLSACDTSVGRIEGEEGVSNIVSAFLYAGAKTAITSFWAIDDSSTSELMTVFYRELERGQSKSGALRTAQLELFRRAGETKSPFFWAAFGLMGDGSGTIEKNARNDKRGT